jgi:NAD(P)-dependent dehydrogenase (short-subunit alcohol dehydrogenase family)
MRERGGGAIVNVAPVAAGVACAASTGAVVALTRALAADHAADRIRVNAVCPDGIDPSAVADAVVFLVEAELVTGTVLSLDGGMK